MKELTTGQILDKILRHCSKTPDSYFFWDDIQKDLFPKLNNDEINNLFSKIKYQKPEIANIEIHCQFSKIQVNGLTKVFLDQGGFTKIEKQENIKQQKIEYKENIEIDILKLQKENSEYQKTLREKTETITELTSKNLKLSNFDIKYRLLIFIITFLIGLFTEYFTNFLKCIKQLLQ